MHLTKYYLFIHKYSIDVASYDDNIPKRIVLCISYCLLFYALKIFLRLSYVHYIFKMKLPSREGKSGGPDKEWVNFQER